MPVWNKSHLMLIATTVMLVVSCTPTEIRTNGPARNNSLAVVLQNGDISSSSNAVCGHRFSELQLAAKPSFIETESNTIISGGNARELLRSLVTTVPDSGIGNTKWDLSWSFNTRNGSRGCSIRDVVTKVNVNYQLPLWPDRLFATNRDLTDQWGRFSDELRQHHCMHGKAGIEASIEVKESLKRMAPRNDCLQLKTDANDLAKSIVSRYKEIESGFDAPVVTDFIRR